MDYVPILMVFAVAAVVAGALLGIPLLIAPKRILPIKQEPFECGKDPVMLPEGRFAIKFSTIAIFFIIFVCALPPTRLTLIPTLIAGRTPAKNSSGSR